MHSFIVTPPDKCLAADLQAKIDNKTKPVGALGRLESLALQIGLVQQSLTPKLNNPHIVVFAADHGIAQDGVSAYPQAVTYQMVLNFLSGGAAINVLTRQNGIGLQIVDAGVKGTFDESLPIVHAKAAEGTQSFLQAEAMTRAQLDFCLSKGSEVVAGLAHQGCNVVGFGEMGIGNTASAAALMSCLLQLPVADCTGRGTGLDDEGLAHKTEVLQRALQVHSAVKGPMAALRALGGFEIAMMCGAMLQAAALNMVVMVDGFIATAAYLCAVQLQPAMQHYAVCCHQSGEQGHALMLQRLGAKPLLNMGMRLGEGTGAALAYPILQSAVAFLHDMASFEQAGVSKKA